MISHFFKELLFLLIHFLSSKLFMHFMKYTSFFVIKRNFMQNFCINIIQNISFPD